MSFFSEVHVDFGSIKASPPMTTCSFSLNEAAQWPARTSFGVGCQAEVELYVEQLLFLLKREYPMKDKITLRLSQIIKNMNL